MKKTLTAMILVFALAFCLAACGSSSAAETAAEEATAPEMPEAPITPGEAAVDVGYFTVTVPEGWLGVGEYEIDENDQYSPAPYSYLIIKGGENAQDQYVKPTLSIYYSPSKSAQALLESNMAPVDENTEFEVTVGGKKCPAYHSVINLSSEGEDPFVMEYDNIFIPATDSSCFRVSMLTFVTSDGETGVSAANEDVIAIMESLKKN